MSRDQEMQLDTNELHFTLHWKSVSGLGNGSVGEENEENRIVILPFDIPWLLLFALIFIFQPDFLTNYRFSNVVV